MFVFNTPVALEELHFCNLVQPDATKKSGSNFILMLLVRACVRTLCTRAFVTPMYTSRVSSLLSNSALRRNLTNQLRPPDDNPALWHNPDVMAHASNNWLPASPGRALSPLLRESVDPLNRRTARSPRRAHSQRSWFKGLYSRQDRKELSSVPSHQWFPLWRLTSLYKAEHNGVVYFGILPFLSYVARLRTQQQTGKGSHF